MEFHFLKEKFTGTSFEHREHELQKLLCEVLAVAICFPSSSYIQELNCSRGGKDYQSSWDEAQMVRETL